MSNIGLSENATDLIKGVLRRHADITGAILYGSRAKGTASPASDIDLALEGITDPLRAAAIASELDELPLPYKFDVRALTAIRSENLLNEIRCSGIRL